MKKVLALLISLCMLLCFASCGESTKENEDASKNNASQTKTNDVLNTQSDHQTKDEFVVGETLENLVEAPFSFPYIEDTSVEIKEISVTKALAYDPKNFDHYVYDGWQGYTFYRYKYAISIKGNVDAKFAGKYVKIRLYTPHGSLSTHTYFEGDLLEKEGLSGTYYSDTNMTRVGGCAFKVGSDGSFAGEFVGHSNDNLNQFMIEEIFSAN